MSEDRTELAAWMLAARAGDAEAYRRLLEALARRVRTAVAAGLRRAGAGTSDCEDIVQETLLAIHLKRHTWDERQPLEPWVNAIARYKLVDCLRRRGGRVHLPIEDFADVFAAPAEGPSLEDRACLDLVSRLDARQQEIVRSISIEGQSAREVGERLDMSEGAVRIALHRALKALAAAYRRGEA